MLIQITPIVNVAIRLIRAGENTGEQACFIDVD